LPTGARVGPDRSWAPDFGLAVGALEDVYAYTHSYIHAWLAERLRGRLDPRRKKKFSNSIHWIWSWKLKEIFEGEFKGGFGGRSKKKNSRDIWKELKGEFEKGLSNEIGGEFKKNSRGDLLQICVLQHKQDSNTEQTQEH
jgi:hypothetical protein